MNTNHELPEKHKNTPASFIERLQQNENMPKITLVIIALIIVIGLFGIARVFSGSATVDANDLAISVQPMGNLTTVEVKVAKIGVEAEMKVGLCTFGSDYLINGTIEAGIDLTNFSAANIEINPDTNAYMMSLPEPQLTRCEFDTQRYNDRKFASCAGIDYRDLNSIARYVASTGMIEDTLDAGLIERSKRETTILIESLVQTLAQRNVEIEYVTPEVAPMLPPSCDLEPPKKFKLGDDGVWQ